MKLLEDKSRLIAILSGGLTHERDVSIKSGARLAYALRQEGHEVVVLDPDDSLLPWLLGNRPDVAISALHGGRGENGDVQTLLELAGVPYLGTRSFDCRTAYDKSVAKTFVLRAGLKTPAWVTLGQATFRDLGAADILKRVVRYLRLPLIVKPNMGGSALGVSLVREPDDLPRGLIDAFAYCDTVLVEEFIDGIELAIPVVEVGSSAAALPAVEIEPIGELYDYDARYTAGLTTFYVPARMGQGELMAASALAVSAHQLLHMRDVSRADIIVDSHGVPYFLEATMSPGLTETSPINLALDVAGSSLGEIYSRLIDQALARRPGLSDD